MDNIKEAVELNIEAQGMLSTAEKHNKLNDGYDAKNLQNIRKHQALLRKQALAFEKQIRKNQKM